MSMRDKLLAAARVAATEERARCLWCADKIVRELRVKLDKKILRSAAEDQLAKVKLSIAEAVVRELRRAIISGVRPAGPGAADLSRVVDHGDEEESDDA